MRSYCYFETEWLHLIWLKLKEEKEIERIIKLQINISLSQEIFLKIALLILSRDYEAP